MLGNITVTAITTFSLATVSYFELRQHIRVIDSPGMMNLPDASGYLTV